MDALVHLGQKRGAGGRGEATAGEPVLSTSLRGMLSANCSTARGGMAQGGGTFHSEMDRCRESQSWTAACSSTPERDGKDRREDTGSPKQVGSCWFARRS